MEQIKIIALTEEGKRILETKGADDKYNKAGRKVVGMKEEVINQDPLTILTTIKRIPKPLMPQIESALVQKFESLGGVRDLDFTVEVL